MDKSTLYYSPGACSFAAHAALEEAGADFDAVRVNLAAGQQRSAAYLAINPAGRVPLLTVGERRFSETVGIVTAIAHLYPQAGLLPLDSPLGLGRAYERMSWLTTTVQVSVSQIFRPERFASNPAVVSLLKDEGRMRVGAHFQAVEAFLEGDWLLDEYSVLDPLLLVFWRWGLRLEMDMAVHRRWREHTARTMARPAVAAALAREQSPAAEPFALAPA
jgi:glutathione S-transferase